MNKKIETREVHQKEVTARMELPASKRPESWRGKGPDSDVAKCKKIENELNESEDNYRILFETANDAIFLADLETGYIIDANKRAGELLGMPVQEIIGMHQSEVHPEEQREFHRKGFKRPIPEGGVITEELQVCRKDGSLVPVEISSNSIEVKGRKAVIAIFRDLSERKRSQEETLLSEYKYRSLFKNMLNGIALCKIILDDNGRPTDFVYLEVNDSFERLTGLKRKNVIGRKVSEAIPGIKEAHPELFEIYGQVALTGKEARFEIFFKPLEIWLYISAYCPEKEHFVAVIENITRRKRMEEMLLTREESHRNLIDHNPDSMIIVDKDGIVRFVNPAAERLFGRKKDKFIGEMFGFPVVKDETTEIEIPGDGKFAVAEMRAVETNWEGETAYVASIRDITERKKAEREIIKAKEEWETTFDSIVEPIMLLDTDFRMMRVNKAMAEKLGVTPSGAVGLTCYESVHGRQEPIPDCPHKKLLADGKAHMTEIMEERLGGYCLVSVSPLYGDGRRLIGSVHYARDITERKKAEEELILRAQLLDGATDSIYLLDMEGRFIYANETTWTSHGYSRDELMAMNIRDLDAPEDADFVGQRIRELKEKGATTFEVAHLRKDGSTMPVEVHARTFRLEDREYILSINRDISERKKDEEKLAGALQKAEEEAGVSSSLLDLSTSISGLLDTKAILEEVSKTVSLLVSSEKNIVFLGDLEEEVYRPVVFYGWPGYLAPTIQALSLSKGDMPAVDTLLQGMDVIISNAGESDLIDRKLTEALDLRALVISPLITSQGILGIVMAEKQKAFSARERRMLKGISSIASISLENAVLYRDSIDTAADLARRMETIKSTTEIDKSILSTLDRQEIMEVVSGNIQRVTPADKMVIMDCDEENRVYRFESESTPFGTCALLDSVIRTGRVVSVPDLAHYRQRECNVVKNIRKGFGSLIALPLHAKGKRFGCVIMASKRVGAFDRDDIANCERLTAQISIALENAKLYEDIKDLFLSTVRALSQAIDAKSPWTKGHSERVTRYAGGLGREMGLSDVEFENLEIAGLLHDVGKIGTFDVVLDKPEKLTEEEFELVKKHPGKGAEILEPIKQLKDVIPAIRYHHEKLDGSGYPEGLRGDEIPLMAKILCIADSYDSMTADRPYRPAPGKEYAISELKMYSGTQFDPDAVEAFLRVLESES